MENSKEKFRKKELGAEDEHSKTTKNICFLHIRNPLSSHYRSSLISSKLMACTSSPLGRLVGNN